MSRAPHLLLLALLLGFGGTLHAQASPTTAPEAITSTATQADRLNWPRTFTGQPDFAFTRQEAWAESRRRAQQDNLPMPTLPTLAQLLEDQSLPDPLGLGSTDLLLSDDASPSVLTTPATTIDPALAAALPSIENIPSADVEAFRQNLPRVLAEAVANWQPNLADYDFSALTKALTLQAIVLSPLTYTVINGQRYSVGDTFVLTVPLDVPEARLTTALTNALPPSNTLRPEEYTAYVQAAENQLAAYTAARSQTPDLGQQTVRIPVRVVAIQARHVQLEVNGQPYELAIRYAY